MRIKFTFVLAVFCLVATGSLPAQVARYYNLFSLAEGATNDTTTTIPAGTTNQIVASGVTNQYGSPTNTILITSSNIFLNCYEFDKCGFTFQSTGIAGSTNGVFGVQIYGSVTRGYVWDTTPRWNFTTTNTAPGGQTYTIVTNLDLSGLDRLAFVFLNGSATGYQTNVLAGVRFKATKVFSRPAED